MTVTQIYEIVNTITNEVTGGSAIVQEDLGNIVSIGETIANAYGYDNFTKKLVDHIGRMVFVNRKYSGRAPSVLMDGWEYGSIMEKVSAVLPGATENESWELENGSSYDPNIFVKPEVSVTYWNDRVTFEIQLSITERQVKSAFDSAGQMNSFISMLYTMVENSMTLKLDALIMRTINNLAASTVKADFGSNDFGGGSHVKAVNLLYAYNNGPNSGGTPLTAAKALSSTDFVKFASYTMANYIDRMAVYSKLFNIAGKERFTPRDRLHVVMLSEFKNAANVYLQSSTFHDQYTALPNAESVAFWQGSGTDYAFANTSKIYVTTAANDSVTVSGVLGVMFDRDALGVCCQNRRVTTNYNPKAEFYNNWYKMDAQYFNDTAENMVVFFVQDSAN